MFRRHPCILVAGCPSGYPPRWPLKTLRLGAGGHRVSIQAVMKLRATRGEVEAAVALARVLGCERIAIGSGSRGRGCSPHQSRGQNCGGRKDSRLHVDSFSLADDSARPQLVSAVTAFLAVVATHPPAVAIFSFPDRPETAGELRGLCRTDTIALWCNNCQRPTTARACCFTGPSRNQWSNSTK